MCESNSRSPGRARRKPLKPFARGMPEVSGEPVVTTFVCFLSHENCGCASSRPAFPAPSDFSRDVVSDHSEAICLAGMQNRAWLAEIVIARHRVSPSARPMTGSCGRSSIPETSMLEPRSWDVLDAPPSRGMTSGMEAQGKVAGRDDEASRPLLTGAGGVGLQRANALGERAAAFRRAAMGGCAVDRAVRLLGGLGGEQGLDRGVRPFELNRELGDFGGGVVA